MNDNPCGAYMPTTRIACDLPLDHPGDHSAIDRAGRPVAWENPARLNVRCYICEDRHRGRTEWFGEYICGICHDRVDRITRRLVALDRPAIDVTNAKLYDLHASALDAATSHSDGLASWAFQMGRASAYYGLLDGTDGEAATKLDLATMRRLDAAANSVSR